MLTCDLIMAHTLTANDTARWHEMMRATPAFQSPILSPEFVQAVSRARADVYVAVFKRNGESVGYLAHHRRPNRFARPAGAPFSDYTALITFPGANIDGREALSAAQIDQFQAIGLIDPHGVFGEVSGESDDAYGIDLSFDEPTNQVNKKQAKNINRLRRNMTEALGAPRFIVGDTDRARFERMLSLKREQTRLTGLHDFLGTPWVGRFLEQLFTAPVDGLHGSMLTLMAGDQPLLYHYGIRLGDRMHPWVSSYETAFGTFSPGQIFLNDCQAPLKAAGIAYYDLSTGQQHYKNSFCNTHFTVTHARLYGASKRAAFSRKMANIGTRASHALGGRIDTAVTRLSRRMDQIACLELDFPSRVKGMAYAVSNAGKRLRGHDG